MILVFKCSSEWKKSQCILKSNLVGIVMKIGGINVIKIEQNTSSKPQGSLEKTLEVGDFARHLGNS